MPKLIAGLGLTEPQPSPATLRHELVIRQFPSEARASIKTRHERRPLDPIPAVELRFFEHADSEDDATEKKVTVPMDQLTGYTLFAQLVDAESEKKIEYVRDGTTEALCGISISSLFRGPNEDGRSTLFFAFPNLGVCATGKFRLLFTLSLFGPKGCSTPMAVYSAPFKVVTAANYCGVQNASPLTTALALSGARARVRSKARGANPRQRTADDAPSVSAISSDKSRPLKRGRRSTGRVQPTPLPLLLHAPQPRYPLNGALTALLAHTTSQRVSSASSAVSAWLSTEGNSFQAQESGSSPFAVEEVEFWDGVMPLDDSEAWFAAQPTEFDPFLADWYSDSVHMSADNEGNL
ncbi:velvet factor-domain-containing protein [Mycena galopus ATCC 62051]|nr:velvet factor-domain-containing protein [Mycena galopus ATCC 62051]